MKTPGGDRAGVNHSGAAVTAILADSPCPNALLCRRWAADGDGVYCRLCWRDFTSPKPLQIAEGRA